VRTPTADELADREAIREVANRYAQGIDRLDADLMKSAYWPDAIDDHGLVVGNAWEFVDRVVGSHRRWAWTMHATTNHSIELADDRLTATGELYNVTHLMSADRSELSTWYGRYVDRYERRDDEWRIIHRVCVHEGTEVRAVDRPMPIDTTAFRQGTADRRSI
jgi:ketosteroid isomerase-like protein